MRIFAIGDVHGRADLLAEMHWRIAMDLADQSDRRLACHSSRRLCRPGSGFARRVIDLLIAANTKETRASSSLAGNHDVGFVEFPRST
jgi:serine/threonine protein phosphatase 1